MSQELAPLMRIWEMSNFPIMEMITRKKIIQNTFNCFESRNPIIERSIIFTDVFPSLSYTIIISVNFHFIVPWEERFAWGDPIVMVKIWGHFPLPASLLSSLVLTLVALVRNLPLGDSSLSRFPPSLIQPFDFSLSFLKWHPSTQWNCWCCGHDLYAIDSILICQFGNYLWRDMDVRFLLFRI